MLRIKFEVPTGDLIICDSEMESPKSEDIKHAAKRGRYLCLTTDDEVYYDLGLVFGEAMRSVKGCTFTESGGHYGISVPSGKLVVASVENWLRGKPEHYVDVEPGEYIAQVYTQEVEYQDYREQLVSLVGESTVQSWERIDKLGAYAWIPTLIFLLSLFSSIGRENWYWGIVIMIVSWLPYYTLKRARKYKLVEKAQEEIEQSIPNQLVELQRLPDRQQIPGGCSYVF